MIPRSRSMRMVLVWWLLSLLPVSTRAIAADPRFDKLVDDYFASRFAFRPSEGTAAGLHQFDEKLEDLSRDRIVHRCDELVRYQERLSELRHQNESGQSKLSIDDAIDLNVLQGQVAAELIDLETLRDWEHNPMTYALAGGQCGRLTDEARLRPRREPAPGGDRARKRDPGGLRGGAGRT